MIAFEIANGFGVISQNRLDDYRRLITASEPDDFRRRAEQASHFYEVGVKRNDNEAVRLRIIPNHTIVRSLQSERPYLARARKQIVQMLAKLEAQVLIEQKLHFAVMIRRSRSAA